MNKNDKTLLPFTAEWPVNDPPDEDIASALSMSIEEVEDGLRRMGLDPEKPLPHKTRRLISRERSRCARGADVAGRTHATGSRGLPQFLRFPVQTTARRALPGSSLLPRSSYASLVLLILMIGMFMAQRHQSLRTDLRSLADNFNGSVSHGAQDAQPGRAMHNGATARGGESPGGIRDGTSSPDGGVNDYLMPFLSAGGWGGVTTADGGEGRRNIANAGGEGRRKVPAKENQNTLRASSTRGPVAPPVSTEAPLIEQGQVIRGGEIEKLPLSERNVVGLPSLIPAITRPTPGVRGEPEATREEQRRAVASDGHDGSSGPPANGEWRSLPRVLPAIPDPYSGVELASIVHSRGRVRLVPRGRSGLSGGYRAYLELFFSDGQASEGFPAGFRTSDDPHGFDFQAFAGRRNERLPTISPNQPPTVTLTAAPTTVVFPAECPPGTNPEPGCTRIVQLSSTATDPDGDTLLYTYSTTGGRVTGDGPNATLDLTGVATGAYTVTVEVDDGCGAVGFTSVTIVVIRSAPTSTSPSESASTGGSAPTGSVAGITLRREE